MSITVLRTRWTAALLAFASGCGSPVVVVDDRDQREAIQIRAVLERDGNIPAGWIKHEAGAGRPARFDLTVPKDMERTAIRILARNGLPERKRSGTEEIFVNGADLIPTPTQDRARLVAAIEGDIEKKMGRIPQVVDAHAFVSVPEKEIALDPSEIRPRAKVSVQVTYLPDAAGRPPLSESEIQEIVASKLEGVAPKDVKVKLVPQSDGPKASESPGGEARCVKQTILGLDVCAESRSGFLDLLLGAVVLSGVLAGGVILSALRAMRYRKDLTRLSAQVSPGRPPRD